MSKVLKFIVHFIVICTIVCVVGLAVPPFLGITTEIMDDSSKDRICRWDPLPMQFR